MKFKFKERTGGRVVLKQSHTGKIAMIFSEKYNLVNAINLAYLAMVVYKEMDANDKSFSALSLKGRYSPGSGPAPIKGPFLTPYLGKKAYSAENISLIEASPSLLSIIDTQGFHYNDDEYNGFSFRGTAGLKDLAADGFAPKVDFLAGKVHSGFYENFAAIRNQIIHILEKPENQKCKTIITAHSLGGALATLSAAWISMKYPSQPCGQVMVYTYGSPRVGEKPWVDHFSNKFIHFRHRNTHDPITMLPPHHSSMKMPTASAIRNGMDIGGVTGGLIVIGEGILRASEADLAFIHHGQGILLHEGPYGVGVIKTELNHEVVVADGKNWNSKQVLLVREFVKNIVAFNHLVGPHSMSLYFSNVFHIFKEAIKSWDKEPTTWLKKNQAASKHFQESIDALKKGRLRAALEVDTSIGVQSSTYTPESRQPISHEEKLMFYGTLIQNDIHAKMMADNEVNIWSQPGAEKKALSLLISGELSPDIEKELRYQETVSETIDHGAPIYIPRVLMM